MSLTTNVQGWLGDVGGRERSALIARTHIAAETDIDVDRICATISHDVYFGVPVRTRDGNRIPAGTVLTGYDQVRGYYEGRAGAYVVLDSAQLKSVATDWYLFNETAATLRGTGVVNGVDATGQQWVVNSAVIFPTAPDGIRGEICVTRYPMEDIVAGTVTVPPPPAADRPWLPAAEMANGALLDRFSLALRDGEKAQVAEALADDHTAAVRLDDSAGAPQVLTATDRSGATDVLGQLFEGVADLTMMVRIATAWYVFAEYLVRLEGGGVRRMALTHPVDGGRLSGTFGYGREER